MEILILLIIWNLITFAMFGIDKQRAKKDMWRISEKTLLLSSLFMGSIGGFFGMYVFHHKTKNPKFTFMMPLFVVLNFAVVLFLLTGGK